jgi:hypothetical protein
MALAIKFQGMIDRGEVRDYADIARLGYVNHPNVRAQNNYFSRSGEGVSTSYAFALRKEGSPIRQVGAIRLGKDDTAVVIGSRLANSFAQDYLGHASMSPDRIQPIRIAGVACVKPRWTFYSDPAAPPVEVVQWGKKWPSRRSLIAECAKNGRTYTTPESLHQKSGSKYRQDDYLLLHVLPRYGVRHLQRVVIFEGLHRNGTRAAGLLCSQPPLEDLRRIANTVGVNPYFQALFKVETQVDSQGEANPVSVKLCDDPFPLRF